MSRAEGRRSRRLGLAAAAITALAAACPATARAETSRIDFSPASPMRAERGLQLGARIGYALPTGSVGGDTSSSTSLSHLETALVPIGLDGGYRLSPHFYVGGTAVWAPGTGPASPSPCTTQGVSCFRQDAQLRGEVRAYLAPYGKVGWWASAGAGWELASFAQTLSGSGNGTVHSTRTGPILPDLQLGFDVRREATAVGFYVGLSVAEFLTQGVDPAAASEPTWIPDRAVHTYVTLGMRGSYGPW